MTTSREKRSTIPMTLAIPEEARSMAIIDGTVKPEGIDLTVTHKFKSVRERHTAVAAGKYDSGEMSTSGFISMMAQGGNLVALPVFFLRGFRQGNIFCRKDSPIKTFADLKGKTIAVTAFFATTIVWVRGMLHHDYGVPRESVTWLSAEESIAESGPTKIKYTALNKGRDALWEMLDKREIDAAIFPGNNNAYSFNPGGSLSEDIEKRGNLRTIQDDRDTITKYYKKTGIYSIIHTITMKADLAKRYPESAGKLLTALRQSRELALKYESPEEKRLSAEEIKFLGFDPYACRLLDPDKKALNTLMQLMVEEGLLKKALPLDSLFAEGTV